MGNKLREIFTKDENVTIRFLNEARAFKRQMLQDRHCEYCIHAINQPHYDHGKDGGTDIFCPIFNKLKLEYDDGMQCIFWEENKEKTEKFK